MKIVVEQSAQQLGIIAPAACVFSNVAIHAQGRSILQPDIDRLLNTLSSPDYDGLTTPETAGFAELFRKMGHPEVIPAGVRLVRTFQEKGFRSFNNLIDAYNIVSAKHGAGLGLHDCEDIGREIIVCRADGNEEIKPIFTDKIKKVPEGDVIYHSGERVIAWLGKKDVDSDYFRIRESTNSALLVVLGNGKTDHAHNVSICHEVYELLLKTSADAEMHPLEVVLN